jgi:hypothetical protein
MQDHETTMSEAFTSREVDVMGLYYAIDGKGVPTNADELGIDVDDLEESARDALCSYALDVSTSTVLTVTLGVGGPTTYLSATIERVGHGWERQTAVSFFHSWAVPNETTLPDDSSLVRMFDEHVEVHPTD